MKKVSLQDIAAHLNVSKSLVSFVLNGQGDEKGIHPDTQKRVMEKARELNYKPNFIARGLRLGKSHTIGLIVADISNNFYARIAKRIEKIAWKNGYHLIFCSSDEDPEKEVALIEMLRERQVDGLIISTTQRKSTCFTQMKKEKFPFVMIDRELPMLKTNFVGVENYEGGFLATERLIQCGYERIALLKISPAHLSTVREREQGYRDALKAYGIKVNHHLIREIDFRDPGSNVFREMKDLTGPPHSIDAVFTVNNSVAIACMEYLDKSNLALPDDVALISFDDNDLFSLSFPSITAIAQPLDHIGEKAVNLLLDEIHGRAHSKPVRHVLPVEFMERGSSQRRNGKKEASRGRALQFTDYEN